MKTALILRQANVQTLTMTPQLQQAIRLLQLSTVELQVEIQENLDKNPLLEVDESQVNNNMESLDALTDRERSAERADDDFNPFNNDRTVSQDDAPYQSNDAGSYEPSPLGGDTYTQDSPDFLANVSEPQKASDTQDKNKDEARNEGFSASISQGRSFDGDDVAYLGESSWEL